MAQTMSKAQTASEKWSIVDLAWATGASKQDAPASSPVVAEFDSRAAALTFMCDGRDPLTAANINTAQHAAWIMRLGSRQEHETKESARRCRLELAALTPILNTAAVKSARRRAAGCAYY